MGRKSKAKRYYKRFLDFWVRHQSPIFQVLGSWAIGLLALTLAPYGNLDNRFSIRPIQKVEPKIVLLSLSENDIQELYLKKPSLIKPAMEISDVTDGLFWDQMTWIKILRTILAQNPAAIGSTFFFGDNISAKTLTEEELKIFTDPRVIWAANIYNHSEIILPRFANQEKPNFGVSSTLRDEDDVVRRHSGMVGSSIHMVDRIASIVTGKLVTSSSKSQLINFRGPSAFPEIKLNDIFQNSLHPDYFKGKIVLIGSQIAEERFFLTPTGVMSRNELFANILDNTIHDRWPKQLPIWAYWLLLLFLALVMMAITNNYSHSVVLPLFIWVYTLMSALSVWIFDSFYLWLPNLAPGLQLIATWLIFIGHETNQIERKNWQLKQDRKFREEVERLKSNFVSLISHDLKTPISKIQAISQSLLLRVKDPDLERDFKAIYTAGDELNRYIQSILKVIRVESQDLKLNPQSTDINELIHNVSEQVTPLAQAKKLTISLELEPMFSIEIDPILIQEVILNLVENAIKFSSTGGQIALRSSESNNSIRVDVIDTGEGIGSEELERIWDKFVRGKNQDLKTKGTGLGLYLVKYFIELHGGKVFAKSAPGAGAEFSFELPIESPMGGTQDDTVKRFDS